MDSDQELIELVNEGDPDAFEALYYRYRDWVYRLAWRFTGNQQDTLDVLQETFIYLLGKFPGFSLTDITIDWGNMQVTDVYPHRIRDLFVGRPVILTGRFKGLHSTTIRVCGKVGDLKQEIAIGVNLDDSAVTHPGIACVWARKKKFGIFNRPFISSSSDMRFFIHDIYRASNSFVSVAENKN